MATVKIDNVRIKDLLLLLTKLSMNFDAVDIIVDPEKRKVVLDPILPSGRKRPPGEIKLTDDNISDLV